MTPAPTPEFTPGPWEITDEHSKSIFIEGQPDEWERLFCEVSKDDCDSETARANARLIASAPALYAALQAQEEADARSKEWDEWSLCNGVEPNFWASTNRALAEEFKGATAKARALRAAALTAATPNPQH